MGETATKTKTIYLICPVRNATDDEKASLEAYMKAQERKGTRVYYPARDTDQNDPRGLRICSQNLAAIETSDEIHVFWNGQSTGSLFDFGMAFALGKPVVLINEKHVEGMLVEGKKSFEKVLFDVARAYERDKRAERSADISSAKR